MKAAPAVQPLDVSGLPSYAFGSRTPLWWATLGLIAIEGTVFAGAVVSYFYLRSLAPQWPLRTPPPDLLWGTLNTLVMLASLVPNYLVDRAARGGQWAAMRRWLWVALAMALVFLALRVLEFRTLNVRWDLDAYGSLVWLLLGLHTVHLLTDTFDTAVLGVLISTDPPEGRRRSDVSENAFYWYFVVASWLPIYAVLYWVPRF